YSSLCFFFSSRRRHTRFSRDWSSDVALPILLRECLRGLPLTYVIMDKTIVLKEKEAKIPTRNNTQLNNRSVTSVSPSQQHIVTRSEERRVGKECRARCEEYHEKKTRVLAAKR